jgi:hypothetical protein
MTTENETVKWFKRGFMLTTLVLLGAFLVLLPAIGVAQDASEEDSNAEELGSLEPPDVVLTGDVDLEQYVREHHKLAPEDFVSPLIIPAADFRGDNGGSTYYFTFSGGYMYPNGSTACVMAPAYLPIGKKILNFFVYAYDNHANDFQLDLYRKRNDTTSTAAGNRDVLATVNVINESTSVQTLGDTSILTGADVVSRDFSYYVTTCLNATSNLQRIYGIWIFYT